MTVGMSGVVTSWRTASPLCTALTNNTCLSGTGCALQTESVFEMSHKLFTSSAHEDRRACCMCGSITVALGLTRRGEHPLRALLYVSASREAVRDKALQSQSALKRYRHGKAGYVSSVVLSTGM